MKSPAFQFYPDDFLGSGKVGTMTASEVGAYTLLLCLDWNENGFFFDAEELARWCRMTRGNFRKVWKRVSRCFEEHEGRMYNPRLQMEREKQAEWRAKSSKGGTASAQARAKGGSTTLEPPYQPNGNTPSPSPTKNKSTANAVSRARPPRESWVADGVALWTRLVGTIPHVEFGAALKPMITLHGWPAVQPDLEKWVTARLAAGKPCNPTWYAKEASARLAAKPKIRNEDGTLTEYGERITRPDKVPA